MSFGDALHIPFADPERQSVCLSFQTFLAPAPDPSEKYINWYQKEDSLSDLAEFPLSSKRESVQSPREIGCLLVLFLCDPIFSCKDQTFDRHT